MEDFTEFSEGLLPDINPYQADVQSAPQATAPPVGGPAVKGGDFDWGAINVQSREEFDALSPGQQELLKMMKRGVKFTGAQAADFVLQIEQRIGDPVHQAAVQEAQVKIQNRGLRPEPGFRIVTDEQTGEVRQEMIPGSKAQKQDEAARKFVAVAARTVIEDVDRSLEIIERSPRKATGRGQVFFGSLPETDAFSLRNHIESIQGNVGVDSLIRIKQSGAGLGQIPQAQLEMLASLLGKLNPKMRAEDLQFNLNRIREIYSGIMEEAQGPDMELIRLSKEDPEAADQIINRAARQNQPRELPPERVVGGRRFVLNERGNYVPAD